MKRHSYPFLICLLILLNSSNIDFTNSNSNESNSTSQGVYYIDIIKGDYDEPIDSTEGIDVKDLSALKERFDSINNNYTQETQVYFNKDAVERVNTLYNVTFVQKSITLHNENYTYTSDDDSINDKGSLLKDGKIYNFKLKGKTLFEKVNSLISDKDLTESEETSLNPNTLMLDTLTSDYVDTYGPTSVKYSSSLTIDYEGWTRVSENKYLCDRKEVCTDFANILIPGYMDITNKDALFMSAYMTFKKVSVELYEDSLRLRLYANSTQIGKLIDEHLNVDTPNWYLLFAEATIKDINQTKINTIEDYLNPTN